MRLFFAIELPERVRSSLARLRPDGDDRGYRWVDATAMHVTLAFLGQQPADRLEAAQRAGTGAAGESRRAKLKLGQAGSFGPRRAPRVLWVGLDGELEALLALHRSLDARLRQAGFTLEGRPFNPHITLARRRESAAPGLARGWPPARGPDRTEFEFDHLTLFESRLSPRGATYIPLVEFPLGAALDSVG